MKPEDVPDDLVDLAWRADHLDYPCPTIRALDGDAAPSPGPAAATPPGTAPTGTGDGHE